MSQTVQFIASAFGALSAADAVVMALMVACVAIQIRCLRSVQASVASLPVLEERVGRLTRSVALLVDTTEGCFEAVSSQLVRSDDTVTPKRQRQRRVVGASKRGRSVAQIAAQEDVAEGEVALRVRMARDLQAN